MQLKREFKNYEDLRGAYDSKIIQIAMKEGFCISPEKWSLLLYDDTQHDLSMQSFIDKLVTPDLFSQAIKQFANVLRGAGASSQHLSDLESDFKCLSKIANDNQEYYLNPSILTQLLDSIKRILQR